MTQPADQQPPQRNRRDFLQTAGAAAAAAWSMSSAASPAAAPRRREQLALDGGPPAVTAPHAGATTWPQYGKSEEEALLALLHSPSYDPIAKLEQDWKAYFGVEHATAYCNGTSAILSMYFALDLPPGSEVMVPSFTFFATIVPMRLFGLVPVFVDIDPRTLNFDLDDAKRRLTPNTRALMPVHWFGNPCEMNAICEWADEKGLIVIEDAAHAHGAKLDRRWMGSWGRMGIFSYQATKPLPAIEGGMGVYQQQDDCDRATAFGHSDRCHGKYARYGGTGLGTKLRMHPMAAALARCQLRGLAERNAAGLAQVRRLNDQLIELPGLYEQRAPAGAERIYYSSNVLFLDEAEAGLSRGKCLEALRAEGVNASPNRYRLQHKQPLYAESQWWHHPPAIPELPGCDAVHATSLSLPYFTSDQPELVEQYVKAFQKVWAHRAELTR
jgi:dTDP-4-amino-4,6-dideoxygalactose transaminase